jgi:hypothetical protein
LSAETRSRLVDLVPRLASDAPGEIVATAAAAGRVLAAQEYDWHDMCALITSISEVPPDRPTDDTPEWRIHVETALRLQLWRTHWERGFLLGLRKRKSETITQRQSTMLERIFVGGSR